MTFSENNVDLSQMTTLFPTIRPLKLQLDFLALRLTLILLLNLFVHWIQPRAVMESQ